MSTRAELRALVISNLGNRTDKNTVINAALEEGLKHVSRLHFFRSLVSESDIAIVDAETYIDLPATTHQLLEARLIDGTASYPLVIKTKKWLVDRFPNIAEGPIGKPQYGYIEKNDLFLYPISDGSYSVRITVSTNPSFLSLDATENPIPVLDIALVCYATSYVMKSIQMFEYAAPWDLEFKNLLTSAILGDQKGPEVMQLQPFTSGEAASKNNIVRDNDTGIISGSIFF